MKLIIPQFVLSLVQKGKSEIQKASTLMMIVIKLQNMLKNHGPNQAASRVPEEILGVPGPKKFWMSRGAWQDVSKKKKISNHQEVPSQKFFNEQARIAKNLNRPPTECITSLTGSRTLMVGPVINAKVPKFLITLFKKVHILVMELHKQPQMFYSTEVKICPLKSLK